MAEPKTDPKIVKKFYDEKVKKVAERSASEEARARLQTARSVEEIKAKGRVGKLSKQDVKKILREKPYDVQVMDDTATEKKLDKKMRLLKAETISKAAGKQVLKKIPLVGILIPSGPLNKGEQKFVDKMNKDWKKVKDKKMSRAAFKKIYGKGVGNKPSKKKSGGKVSKKYASGSRVAKYKGFNC